MPSKAVTWIEGKAEAQDIMSALVDAITKATLPNSEVNRWTSEYTSDGYMWVTYKENFRNTLGKYRHTDGKLYDVYQILNIQGTKMTVGGSLAMDANGFISEVEPFTIPVVPTGRKLQVKTMTINGETVSVPGLLVVLVNDPTEVTMGKRAYIVEQYRQNLLGVSEEDRGWNEFVLRDEIPAEYGWAWYLSSFGTSSPGMVFNVTYSSYGNNNMDVVAVKTYSFEERFYTADPTHTTDKTYVLGCVPDTPEGMNPSVFYLMLKQPTGQFNYLDVSYGNDIVGIDAVGDSTVTYEDVCDPVTVGAGKTPTIIDQKKAEDVYLKWKSGDISFSPPSVYIGKDIDGVTDLISPPAHFFFGADSNVAWLANKKRRPDYWVRFYISLNNSRACIVLEGDPAPDMDGYYRSFGYFGQIVPFNDLDYPNNFGMTVGMGELKTERTGFTLADINPATSAVYSKFGAVTSNGMYSMSMLKTAGNVSFQAHYPSFLTQLPNYTGVGTLPAGLSRLALDKDGFQMSRWTGKYHASPVYLVHQTEGYRGFMDGVVAIADHQLVTLDELVVDTEELKDPNDVSKGTYTEVYKFFSITSPVHFLKYSANPEDSTIAILKEVR